MFQEKYIKHWQYILNSLPQGCWYNKCKHKVCMTQRRAKEIILAHSKEIKVKKEVGFFKVIAEVLP